MLFSSPLFVFPFLPFVLAMYFIVPTKLRNLLLVLVSLFFYAWGEGVYFVVMLVSICVNYIFGILINNFRSYAKWLVALAVIVNIGALVYFKYSIFLIQNVGLLLEQIDISKISSESMHLPLGISFFTFHSISYLIDIYRKDTPAQKTRLT